MMELVLCMTAWAQEVQKSVQSAHYAIDTVKRMAFLRKVGLTNTANANEIEAYSDKAALLQFMCKMWNDLGHDTLLVRTEDFYKILCKHDLMCGDFSLYNGEIPEKNMQEIETAIEAYEGGLMDGYADPIEYVSTVYLDYGYGAGNERYTKKYHIDGARIPFATKDGQPLIVPNDGTEKCYLEVPSDNSLSLYPFFIAAPRGQMKKVSIYRLESDYSFAGHTVRTYERKRHFQFDEKGEAIFPSPDPFVCSVCKYGIIIHSMWGAEAEDATIKRYEQLRDAIMGKGGGHV